MSHHASVKASPAIVVDRLCKTYPASRGAYWPVLAGQPPRRGKRDIGALQNVSFTIEPGEIVGVIGHNGAGKSTLLRLLAGLSNPSSGSVWLNGSLGTLLDIGAGLEPLKSGLWNIRHRLELLGVPISQRQSITDEIIAFSELQNVIEKSVGSYSSGMRMRLGFTLASAIRPDILLIDEALAVGDEFFAAKSFRRIEALARSGCTSVIVSHDWTKIFRLSTRILWMEGGRVRADGPPAGLLYPFLESLNAFRLTHRACVEAVRMLDDQGRQCISLPSGAPLTLEVHYRKQPDLPAFAVIPGVTSALTGESVLSAWSMDDQVVIGNPGEEVGLFRLRYPQLPVYPGAYDLSLLLIDPAQGAFPVEHLDIWGPLTAENCRLEVTGEGESHRASPLISLTPRWEVRSA